MARRGVEAVRTWLLTEAAPFWAARGFDRLHGGTVEKLALDGAPILGGARRVRVAGRQIYVFAQLSLWGAAGALDIARALYADIERRAWLGPERGWARLIAAEGGVLDPGPDLYDTAFMAFACAWLARAAQSDAPLARAEATLDMIERHMRAPGGGFWHEGTASAPPATPRLQNPHMHLLEAAHALYETDPRPRFRDLAEELFALFRTRFRDNETGVLGEYFEADLKRLEGPKGRRVEPGHHFEWVWLAHRHATLFGADIGDVPERLAAFAERFGVDRESGRVFMEIDEGGAPLDRSSRTWTATERLKAHLALAERGGPVGPEISQTLDVLFDGFLSGPMPGAWIDHVDGEGRALAKDIPASTLYHVVLAFSEALRCAAIVDAAP
jgi:N-acylglucosamine 2-epimerase/mannose-6-phosphate isomerase